MTVEDERAMEKNPESGRSAMDTINDPRVSAFLRLLTPVLTAVVAGLIMTCITMLSTMTGKQNEIIWRIDQLTGRVNRTEQTSEKLENDVQELKVGERVRSESARSFQWRIGRLERKAGLD